MLKYFKCSDVLKEDSKVITAKMMPEEQLWHNLSIRIHVDWKVKDNFWLLSSPSSSSDSKLNRVERQSATAISVLTASACDATEWMGPFHYKCTFVQKVEAILQILTNAKTMQNNSFYFHIQLHNCNCKYQTGKQVQIMQMGHWYLRQMRNSSEFFLLCSLVFEWAMI